MFLLIFFVVFHILSIFAICLLINIYIYNMKVFCTCVPKDQSSPEGSFMPPFTLSGDFISIVEHLKPIVVDIIKNIPNRENFDFFIVSKSSNNRYRICV